MLPTDQQLKENEFIFDTGLFMEYYPGSPIDRKVANCSPVQKFNMKIWLHKKYFYSLKQYIDQCWWYMALFPEF